MGAGHNISEETGSLRIELGSESPNGHEGGLVQPRVKKVRHSGGRIYLQSSWERERTVRSGGMGCVTP